VASQPVELFFSYSHKDQELRNELETHLAMLKNEGVIRGWQDRQITPGQEWDGQIDEHLSSAGIILLLASPDFLASKYCYDIEVARAMERHRVGEACVIPVIVRPCEWQRTPFGKLQALPAGTVPVTRWPDRDEAFLNVAEGIRRAVESLLSSREGRRETSDETAKPSRLVPIPRPPFIGFVARRDAQGHDIVGRLKEELAPGRNQPVTLSGPGGIGKTTLAAEAARALLPAYDERVTWSSADGRADFALLSLLDDIATQLGRAELRTLAPAIKEEQVRALVADAPALVVLDNYETIAAEEKKRIEAWFKAARCSALFTSRPKLSGTVFVPVSAMSRTEADEFLERLAGQTQGAQIFTAEVRRRVYEMAEANPFVMQWVVGQIDDAQEPDAVLKELAQGQGDAAERVFERSFNLLDGDGRDALLALSLFAPSATRDALSAAAGFDDEGRVREAVRNLHRLWLIKLLDEHRRLAVEGLTRTLAAARLSADTNANGFRQHFIRYYCGYAVAHAQPTLEDFDALEAEKDNLLKAIDTAFDLEEWEVVVEIMNSLEFDGVRGFLSTRGYWEDSLERGQKAIEAIHKLQIKGGEARYIHNIAYIRRNQGGNIQAAQQLYEESLRLAETHGDLSLIALILHEKAGLANAEAARQLYYQSLEIKKRINDLKGVGYTLHELGLWNRKQDNIAEAIKLFHQSLEIASEHNDERGIAGTSLELGWLERMRHNYREARQLYTKSLEIKKKWGDKRGIAGALCELGALELDEGNMQKASQLLDRSLELNRQINHQQGIANTLRELGRLQNTRGAFAKARRFYVESLEITEKLGEQIGSAVTLHQLGMISEREGDKAEAARLFREALSIFERLGSPSAENARRSLARLEGKSS
jgi:tetratricopeptide (TPR) repeat protein